MSCVNRSQFTNNDTIYTNFYFYVYSVKKCLMKKLVLIIIALIGISYAQNGNHIHHLFGLKESASGLFTQSALNQKNGNEVEIETFSLSFDLGSAYAFYTVNNKVLYVDTVSQTVGLLTEYALPEIYETGYSGISTNQSTLQGSIIDICVDPDTDTVVYGFEFLQKTLYSFSNIGGSIINTSDQLNNFVDKASFNMTYNNGMLYLAGRNSQNEIALVVIEAGTLIVLDSFAFSSEHIYLTSHPTLGVYGVAQDDTGVNTLVFYDQNLALFEVVDTLPSCNVCAAETFTYDKNAMVLDPENSEIILSRTETINGNVSHYLSTYSLQNGAEIYNVETPDKWSNLVFQKPEPDGPVPGWPPTSWLRPSRSRFRRLPRR